MISAIAQKAYDLLGLTADQVASVAQITPELREIERTIRGGRIRMAKGETSSAIDLYGPGADVRTAWPLYLIGSDHPDARKLLLVYVTIPKAIRRYCPIEAFCLAANVSPHGILSIIIGEIVRRGAQIRTVIAMVNQPRMVQKMVESGLTDDGFSDRELLAKATGFLPSAKGAQTIVNVAATASSDARAVSLPAPPPEATIRRLVDRFNDQKSLGPAQPSGIPVASTTPEAEFARVIDVDIDDDSEED